MQIILKVDVYPFSIPCTPFVISLGTLYEAQNVLIKITTEAGLIGFGEGCPFPMIASESQASSLAIANDFAKILIGKNALDIEDCMAALHQFVPQCYTTKSAFDMALYDIAAQNAGLPLYKFLNGENKTFITDETIVIGTPKEMAQRAETLVEKGAQFIKIKLGKGTADDDIERVKAIYAVVPQNIKLRLDANQGWNVANSIYILNALENCNVQYCEQPVKYYDFEGLKKVKNSSPIKVMADESCFTSRDAAALIAMQACDYINIKFAKCGGILEATKIANLAAEANMPCMLGGMIESKLALTANAHFAAAHPIIQFFDLDFCFPHTQNLVIGGVVFENNYTIHLPQSIGIGATVDV
jgi:L-Ala-D/L-Glu epimerase